MTTVIAFQPSTVAPPQFIATFDGVQYRVVVTWSLFGQRYYANCYGLDGVRIFTVPVVTSPPTVALANLAWDVTTNRVIASTVSPHPWAIGTIVNLSIEASTPDAYNGTFACSILDNQTFVYDMATNPGNMTTAGSADYLISLTAGYFNSTMVYRNSAFEVRP